MTSSDPTSRLEALEAHVAEQGRTIEELSEVAIRQQKEIDRLNARLTRTFDRIGELESRAPSPASEKPPHY